MTKKTESLESENNQTPRSTQRPEEFDKPLHWTNEPVPEPKAVDPEKDEPRELSPTRYGDWEKNGIAWDF
jgi:hypothetical protein